jgi:hypothetical protein
MTLHEKIDTAAKRFVIENYRLPTFVDFQLILQAMLLASTITLEDIIENTLKSA